MLTVESRAFIQQYLEAISGKAKSPALVEQYDEKQSCGRVVAWPCCPDYATTRLRDDFRIKRELMVTLLPFDPKLHVGLLAQWLNHEHVRESWGDPAANLASIMALRPPAGCALIAANGVLVGFVQWQPMGARELLESGVEAPDDETIDIDIFIGEEKYLGRGIGPAALEVLMKQIKEEGVAKRVTLFTGVENERALHAYAKAGFRVRSHYMDAEHGWSTVLMAELLSWRQEQ